MGMGMEDGGHGLSVDIIVILMCNACAFPLGKVGPKYGIHEKMKQSVFYQMKQIVWTAT